MSMPFDCGALKPTADRYLDRQFRTFARRFSVRKRLDYDDAVCLAAFLAVVPLWAAAWIFQWDKYGKRAAKSVKRWFTDAAHDHIQANLAGLDISDGLAVVQAMKDGGWTGGRLPEISKRAMREAVHNGMSIAAVMKATGLSRGSVNGHVYGAYGHSERRARAVGLLAV